MDFIANKLVLVDFEIERALLKKKHLEFYLAELYQMKEDLFIEWENQEQLCNKCECENG